MGRPYRKQELEEAARCFGDCAHFLRNHVKIDNTTKGGWIPFVIWPAQFLVLSILLKNRLVVILKARQLGLTWLCLGYALWQMLFRPTATVGLFSRRDTESVVLLQRLRGMFERLPSWIDVSATTDNDHELRLSNGSVAYALPPNAGDSYTFSFVLADEFDLYEKQKDFLASVKPTVDAGGSMVLLSRSNKRRPITPFKKIYRAAKKGLSEWVSVFLDWRSRPERDDDWYERQKIDIQQSDGSLDRLHEQYPETDSQALKPNTLDKRIPSDWIENNYFEQETIEVPAAAPALPGLIMYEAPVPGERYIIGGDPAEGNPTSDDSAGNVLHKSSGRQVAKLKGKFEMTIFGGYLLRLSKYYNNAGMLIERNNHGHTVIKHLLERNGRVLAGSDRKAGWLSSQRGKVELYDDCADGFRNDDLTVVDMETYTQLASIEANTLRAPKDLHDDDADSFALANVGRRCRRYRPTADERRKRPLRRKRRNE